MRLAGGVQERSHSQERSHDNVGHVVRAAEHVTKRLCHAGPAGQHDLLGCASIALLSILAEHIESKSGLEDQAGRRVEGKMGSPVERRGAERLAGESEHVRAQGCASCAAACKARAPQGTPGAGCTRGAEVGWFSLGYFSLTIQREVTRPPGRNALALEAQSQSQCRSQSQRQWQSQRQRQSQSQRQRQSSRAEPPQQRRTSANIAD